MPIIGSFGAGNLFIVQILDLMEILQMDIFLAEVLEVVEVLELELE
jgi:hypothetical protein